MQERKTIQQTNSIQLQYSLKNLEVRIQAYGGNDFIMAGLVGAAVGKELDRRDKEGTFRTYHKNLDTGKITVNREDVTLGGL